MFKTSNRPFLIAAIIASIVTALLALHRHYDINEPLNESILETWGTIMAAIFTATTVYLLYQQNKQQLDDRKAASKPDIYPSEANVLTHDETKNEENGYGRSQESRTKVLFKQYKDSLDKSFEMYIPIVLHNIGLGAAKRVKYKWEFNKLDVFNYVDGAYYLTPPTLNKNNIHLETIIDFIAANNSVTIYFPYYFSTCFGLTINVNNDEGFHKTVPELRLYIDYLDIHDNVFPKTFKVSFTSILGFIDIKFNEIQS